MTQPTFICPQPIPWNDIHRVLTEFHRDNCPEAPQPPVPLILAGWAYSGDEEKAARWQTIVTWAARHGATELIPDLADCDRYPPSTAH